MKIYILLYVCHMLKLLRNILACHDIIDADGGRVSWLFIDKLHNLQEKEGLRAGNRLRTAHINWQKQTMSELGSTDSEL